MRTSLFTLLVFAMTASPMLAQREPSPAEQTLLELANQNRAAQGVPPLAWDPALARAARVHDRRMMHEPGELMHQYPGEPDLTTRASQAGAHFSTISENLAAGGPDAAAIEQKWMSTKVHRDNTLDPRLNIIGIAVIEENGVLYAVEDLGRNAPALHQGDIERQAQELLLEQGIKPATADEAREDARKNCAMTSGSTGHPLLVIRWEGSDLTQLPAAILQQMPSARSHTAAVASCPTQQSNPGFTTYRVTVLLY
jgi:uncharacterized protein YkwD